MFSTCARCGSRSRIAAASTSPPHAKTMRSEDLNRRRQLVNLAVALLAMCPVTLQAQPSFVQRAPDRKGADPGQPVRSLAQGFLQQAQGPRRRAVLLAL